MGAEGSLSGSLPPRGDWSKGPTCGGEITQTGNGFFSGFDENLDVQGELILQDAFQVWDPKSLIRKGRERHLFLFEISLVFSKEIKDSSGHTKYVYKNKRLVGGAGGVRRVSPFASSLGQEVILYTLLISPLVPHQHYPGQAKGILVGKCPLSPLPHLRADLSSSCWRGRLPLHPPSLLPTHQARACRSFHPG